MGSKTKFRVILVIGAFAVASLSLGNWAAQAHNKTFKTKTSIFYSSGPNEFFGTVKTGAPRLGCRDDRAVSVYKALPGPDTLIGSDSTDGTGHWNVTNGSPSTGNFYADVAFKDVSTAYHVHLCAADTSKILKVKTA